MKKYEPLNRFFKNTRRHRRFAVDMMDICIQAKTGAETSSSAEDYSAKMLNLGGVLMEGDRLHIPESKLIMEMTLPENVRIPLTGRVTSCITAKNSRGSRYDVGVEFISMTERDRTELKKFIQKIGQFGLDFR